MLLSGFSKLYHLVQSNESASNYSALTKKKNEDSNNKLTTKVFLVFNTVFEKIIERRNFATQCVEI